MNLRSRLPLLCAVAMASCAHATTPAIKIPLTPADKLCAEHPPSDGAMCLPTAKIDHLLRDGDLTVLQARATSSGTNGAMTMWLEFPKDGIVLKAKWKEAARGGSAINNEPRKELAAYALQKLFLEPDDYVVPPTQSRCIPLDVYKTDVRPSHPTFKDTSCAFGVLAYWLSDVKELNGYDKNRFETDIAYRTTIANLNVFGYLFNHRDTRPANFVIAKSAEHPRAFAIDNGLALNGITNPRTIVLHEWSNIVVPKIPFALVDRLRKLTRKDLDSLATVAEFAIDKGQLEAIPVTDAFEDSDGVRQKGNVIQLGLTRHEIDQIEERLKKLLERVDSKKLEQY